MHKNIKELIFLSVNLMLIDFDMRRNFSNEFVLLRFLFLIPNVSFIFSSFSHPCQHIVAECTADSKSRLISARRNVWSVFVSWFVSGFVFILLSVFVSLFVAESSTTAQRTFWAVWSYWEGMYLQTPSEIHLLYCTLYNVKNIHTLTEFQYTIIYTVYWTVSP